MIERVVDQSFLHGKMRGTVISGLFLRSYSLWLVAGGWLSLFRAGLRVKIQQSGDLHA